MKKQIRVSSEPAKKTPGPPPAKPAKAKRKNRVAELEAEMAKLREELETARREHYRSASGGQFGFGPKHWTIEKGYQRWLD